MDRLRRDTLVPDAGAVNAFFETRLYYGLLFAAVALCGLRALSTAEDRPAWACMCVGVGSFALADVYWQVVLSSADDPPFPSIADGGYLAYFPAVYAGLILLFRRRIRTTRAVWLDGVTAALAAAYTLPTLTRCERVHAPRSGMPAP